MQTSRSPTPTFPPKPCLKPLGKVCSSQQKHAHFSEETQRYSALDYDRSPIVVLVNECALPARGERTLDDSNEPKVRRHHHHHHHHHHRSNSTKSASDDDEPHTGIATLATGAPIHTTLMTKSSSASMSSLVHANDSSDSDDGVALPIDGNGLQVYRQALSPDLDQSAPYGAANSASQSRRLRKSPPNRAHGRSASHELRLANNTESFAPWSGSNSCLGGF